MQKKTSMTLVASMLLAGGVLAGCNNAAEEPKKEEPKAEETAAETTEKAAETKEVAIEETAAGKQVKAYQDMKAEAEKAKEGQEVDWEKVSQLYTENLQTAVNEVNGEFDQAIQAAVEAGKNKELDANIARQLMDKTTQAYFYQKQKALHKEIIAALEAKDADQAKALFAELKHLVAQVIVPTAEKRDGLYELTGEASLVENINAGLATQEEALNAGNAEDYSVYTQLTDKSIYRSYYLAANSYAKKVEDAAKEGKDEVELQNMQAEGWGFLQAIKGSLSGGDEAAAQRLDEIFTLNTTKPADVKADEVNSLFTKAIVGKINGYHGKVPEALEKNELTEAKIEALEANMFLKALEITGNEKIGEEPFKAALAKGEEWYNAVADNKKEEAAALSKEILAVVDQLVK
jgi:outer membrane murein-binding lipoprotein Lpp